MERGAAGAAAEKGKRSGTDSGYRNGTWIFCDPFSGRGISGNGGRLYGADVAGAKSNAADLADQISFKRMDAQNLEFPKETFDYIVTRNVTWNLEHPKRAYREWQRVLKPGGKILNFDANWYAYLYDDKLKLGYEQDRQRAKEEQVEDYYEGTDIAWMENIAKQVPLSPLKRPKWDLDVLKKIGFDCWADETIGERVLSDAEKINYQSTPVFMVCAVK